VTDRPLIPIPEELPLLALPEMVLFPYMRTTVEIREQAEIALTDAVLTGNRLLAVYPAEESGEVPVRGTAARIDRMHRQADGALRLTLSGVARINQSRLLRTKPFPVLSVKQAVGAPGHDLRIEALRRACFDAFRKIVEGSSSYGDGLLDVAGRVTTGGHLADLIAAHVHLSFSQKRALLETENVEERLELLRGILDREAKIVQIEERIKGEVDRALQEEERERFLRQQIEAIRRELGEDDERVTQIRELNRRLAETPLPPPVQNVCKEEIARLGRIPVQSGEFSTSRNHIDWILDLPWKEQSRDAIDLGRARRILDKHHYGLLKIKERVLEFLAVRKLKSDSPSPLLCFVGPPGVGKTSLGLSIAVALDRRVAHLSLGGMTDEGEIRGHRRTYAGALPGRILQELRRVGVRNPVFMLDEIDKIGSDFRGDPSAPLLEVLDSDQNRNFSDHYLSLPFDLSDIFFITTANSVDNIPSGLLDRMEIIEFPGYTTSEKVAIAEKHLIPKQMNAHGVSSGTLAVRRRAIRRMIDEYTMEAGLRELERCIAAICRKRAVALLDGDQSRTVVDEKDLHHYLGIPVFHTEMRGSKPEVGIATSLAFTPSGGRILFIEATLMPGRQMLQITGHLGEVMRESVETSLSYVRSFMDERGAPPDLLENHDIHIHVPAGAIAKDGPSAGIAVATALYSLFSGWPVRHTVAMTGEITLRGHVLPVGGVRSKVLGAFRAGIRQVVFPARNLPEVEEIPEEVRSRVELIPVEHVDEVFQAACIPRRQKGG